MSMASCKSTKVVIIETQYVETDPRSFKAVVQSLTGKDMCVAWTGESSFVVQKRSEQAAVHGGVEGSTGVGGAGVGGVSEVTSNHASFKDLEGLLRSGLSPVEEPHRLWTL